MQRQRKLQFLQSIKKGVNYETTKAGFCRLGRAGMAKHTQFIASDLCVEVVRKIRRAKPNDQATE